MKNLKSKALIYFLAISFMGYLQVNVAQARVSADEAAKLGASLTPIGGEKAGNQAATIPAWEGGIAKPVPGYKPGDHHPDPYSNDKPLFTITSANVAQYASHLSPGQQEMFKRYPDTWKMNVYPTRRSAAYPPSYYEATKANATTAELTEDGNGILNAGYGVPFPIPQNGLHVIWNHLTRYRGQTMERKVIQVAPTASGSYTPVAIEERTKWSYATPGETIESINNKLGYFLQTVKSPARLAGNILLVHETLNQRKEPRKAWTYNPGQRRVRRAPNVAYDNPGTASDAQRTSDNLDMFNGAPNRYNWKLVGKREMYVPYNSYYLHSDQHKVDDIVKPGHLSPDYLRYELHRVWVVDATLKSGTSHIYARRTFYIDEDSWQALVVDQYDGRGDIWRVSEAYVINYYDAPLIWDTVHSHYDLQNGRYLAFGFKNEGEMVKFDEEMDLAEFSPEALRRAGRR